MLGAQGCRESIATATAVQSEKTNLLFLPRQND